MKAQKVTPQMIADVLDASRQAYAETSGNFDPKRAQIIKDIFESKYGLYWNAII